MLPAGMILIVAEVLEIDIKLAPKGRAPLPLEESHFRMLVEERISHRNIGLLSFVLERCLSG